MRFLEPGETLILIVRRHWFIFFAETLLIVALAAGPLLFVAILPGSVADALFASDRAAAVAGFLYLLWLIVLWIILFLRWTVYFLDVWLVTDRRLVDIEQKWLFHRTLLTARLDRIQNVSIDVEGIFATLIGFGDVKILTAGDDPDIIIRTARDPGRVKERILELHNSVLERDKRGSAASAGGVS